MTVGELIAKLYEFNLKSPILIKSFISKDGELTLFEEIVEVTMEGLFENYKLKEAVVITPTFENRQDPTSA